MKNQLSQRPQLPSKELMDETDRIKGLFSGGVNIVKSYLMSNPGEGVNWWISRINDFIVSPDELNDIGASSLRTYLYSLKQNGDGFEMFYDALKDILDAALDSYRLGDGQNLWKLLRGQYASDFCVNIANAGELQPYVPQEQEGDCYGDDDTDPERITIDSLEEIGVVTEMSPFQEAAFDAAALVKDDLTVELNLGYIATFNSEQSGDMPRSDASDFTQDTDGEWRKNTLDKGHEPTMDCSEFLSEDGGQPGIFKKFFSRFLDLNPFGKHLRLQKAFFQKIADAGFFSGMVLKHSPSNWDDKIGFLFSKEFEEVKETGNCTCGEIKEGGTSILLRRLSSAGSEDFTEQYEITLSLEDGEVVGFFISAVKKDFEYR